MTCLHWGDGRRRKSTASSLNSIPFSLKMGRQVLSSCHSETKAHGWRAWLVGRWIHLQMHSYQRLRLINKRHRRILQQAWGKERIFDDMNNGFGWSRLPKSFMAENTVFLLLTALIHNFYKTIMSRLDTKAFGLKETSRIKAFVFSFISVPAKWIMTARQYVLNIYTENRAYVRPFKTGFG